MKPLAVVFGRLRYSGTKHSNVAKKMPETNEWFMACCVDFKMNLFAQIFPSDSAVATVLIALRG